MSSALNGIRGLLIDVDDTITRFKAGAKTRNTGSLFDVLQAAGVELGGLSAKETHRRIREVKRATWWHWSDFIVALDLNPKAFWEFAYQMESRYVEATGPEILGALQRLHASGILLYVTSNNPSSGILHKLRLAGIGHVTGTTLFSQLLGATEMHAMKWDVIYWKKVLAHTALDGSDVAVVGDNPHDDYAVPHSAGIAHSFIINRAEDRSACNNDEVTYVRDFNEVADVLIGPST